MSQHRLPRTPKTLEAIPGRSARDEQTMAMILALTSELAVMRARLDTCERLLVAADIFAVDAVDGYVPDAAAQIARDGLRTRVIAKVLRPLQELATQDYEAVTHGANPEEQA